MAEKKLVCTDDMIDIADGKYRVIMPSAHRKFRAQRHGEEWRDLTGDNLVLALASELINTKKHNAQLQKMNEELVEQLRTTEKDEPKAKVDPE